MKTLCLPLLFLAIDGFVLSDVLALEHITQTELPREGAVGENIEQKLLGNDNSLATIVLDLQERLASQEKRIKYPEAREKRKENVIERITLRLTSLERNFGPGQKSAPTKDQNIVEKKNNQQTEKSFNLDLDKNVNSQTFGIFRRQSIRQTSNVAFTAYLDHSVNNLGIGQTIKLNKILLNDGHGYSALTGVFTVPVSGVYMFIYHYNSHYHITIVRMLIDGIETVDAIASPKNSIEAMGGNTAVVRVTEGQSVWLDNEIIVGGEIHTAGVYRYCTFSGVLLY